MSDIKNLQKQMTENFINLQTNQTNMQNNIVKNELSLQTQINNKVDKSYVDNKFDNLDNEILYKTFYYNTDQFINGDYTKINDYIFNFKDIISVYENIDRSDTSYASIIFNDIIYKDPNSKLYIFYDNLNIVLENNLSCSFFGSIKSTYGYYLPNTTHEYKLKSSSNISSDPIIFTKLRIIVGTTNDRKIELYIKN